MPHITLADAPIWWSSMGNGPNKALLLHCSLAHSGAWLPMMAKLNGVFDAVAFDLPGHGQSADWDGTSDVHDQTCAIAAELLDGPADLIGHSFGATVALRLAVERPDLVRSLILIEPVYFAALRGTPAFREYQKLMSGFTGALMAGDRISATRAFSELWGDGQSWLSQPEAQRQYATDRIHLVTAALPGIEKDKAGVFEPGRLEELDIPVLLIRGENSPKLMESIHKRLATRLPRSREVVIEGAAHMAPVTHPVQVAEAISEFIAKDT